MILDLHHATDDKGAYGIDKDQEFHFGSRGFAGPGIYFAVDKNNAIGHAFNGKPEKVTVLISCRVNLGKCLKAEKNTVTQVECLAKGCDSVNIRRTDTYAVYDPARVTILGFKSMRFKDIGLKPSMKVLVAVETFVAAIKASPESCLKPGDVGQLFSQHSGLREAMGSKLKPFCEAHSEFTWTVHGVTLCVHSPSSPASATSESDLENEISSPRSTSEVLLAAIKASPTTSLNISSDMRPLYLSHPGLRDALQEYGGVKGFCEAHPGLERDGQVLSLSPLGLIVDAIQASPGGFLQDMGLVYSNCPGLREAIGSNGLRLFCEAHSELEWEVNKVTLSKQFQLSQYKQQLEVARQQFQKGSKKHEQDTLPSSSTESSTVASDSENESLASDSAFEVLLAAIGESPYGSLDAVADMRSLYLENPSLRNSLREPGELKVFCEGHELSWLHGSLKLSNEQKQEEAGARQQGDAGRQLQMQLDEEKPEQIDRSDKPRRQAIEEVGENVTVHKHSSMGCAIISLREHRVRELILKDLGEKAKVAGTIVHLKPHVDKETEVESMTDIFAAWGRQAEKANPLPEHELMKFFEAKYIEFCATQEEQCRKEKAALEEKQALAKQLQLQREEADEARRQQTLVREIMEKHEARKEREYYEAHRQRAAQELQLKRDAERPDFVEKDHKARLQRWKAKVAVSAC